MLTNNDDLGLSLDVDHEIETKFKISGTKWKLLVSFNGELVGCVNIIVNFLEKFQKSEESIL
jgi:hypothetical protein